MRSICKIDGCSARVRARGWCPKHYGRWQRHGDPLTTVSVAHVRGSMEERFWAKVNLLGPVPDFAPHLGPCWLWTAGLMKGAYGSFVVDTATHTTDGAHRVSYQLTRGEIPDGMQIDHLCRVVACVNPAHLEVVTQEENVRRAVAARPVTKK